MSRSTPFIIACFIIGSGISSSGEEKSDMAKALQGQWRGIQLVVNDVEAATEDAKAFRVTVKGNELTLMTCKGDRCVERKQTFNLDLKKTPMEIDLTSLDGVEKGQIQRGIFAMEQGRWRLCAPLNGGERPKSFKTKADDGLMVIVLEHAKPD